MFHSIDSFIEKTGTPCCIIIAGMTCSGKTTLADKIKKHYEGKYTTAILHQDDWYKDLKDVPLSEDGYLLDSINAFDREGYRNACKRLMSEGKTDVPVYDIRSNMRTEETKTTQRGDINIFEGLHAITLTSTTREAFIIYADTPPSLCRERRMERDTTLYRGATPERFKKIWKKCIMPMSDCYVWPQKPFADLVVKPGEEDGEE